jgi:hypothetical protein
MILRLAGGLTMVAAALSAGPLNYVVNGDFENGVTAGVLSAALAAPPDNYTIYVFGVGGATNLGGWTISGSGNNNGSGTPLSLVVTGNPPQAPESGSYAVDFDPFWNIATGAILGPTVTGTLPELSQTMFLPVGDYVLSFYGALEVGGPVTTRPLNVTLSGAAALNEIATAAIVDASGYQLFSYDFASTGGNVTLSFTPNDYSPEPNFMLDNVQVTATPEPSTGALCAIAVATVLALRRRRWAA